LDSLIFGSDGHYKTQAKGQPYQRIDGDSVYVEDVNNHVEHTDEQPYLTLAVVSKTGRNIRCHELCCVACRMPDIVGISEHKIKTESA